MRAQSVWDALVALAIVAASHDVPADVRASVWASVRTIAAWPRVLRILGAAGHKGRRAALNRSYGQLRRAHPGVFADAARWLRSDEARVAFVGRGMRGDYCTLLADAFDRVEAGKPAHEAFGFAAGRPSPKAFDWLDDAAAVVEWRWRTIEKRNRRRLKAVAIDVLGKIGAPMSRLPEVYARRRSLEAIEDDELALWAAWAGVARALPRGFVPEFTNRPRRGARLAERAAAVQVEHQLGAASRIRSRLPPDHAE